MVFFYKIKSDFAPKAGNSGESVFQVIVSVKSVIVNRIIGDSFRKNGDRIRKNGDSFRKIGDN